MDLRPPFAFVRKNTWMPRIGLLGEYHGWGNGYVSLPKGHPWYGMDYEKIPVLIHCGLTYGQFKGGRYVIGFDTGHYLDTLATWPRQRVRRESDLLCRLAYRAVVRRRCLSRW